MSDESARITQDEQDALLNRSVNFIHGCDTCDPAGRPLTTYTCEYHQGFEDGIDAVCQHFERLQADHCDAITADSLVGPESKVVDLMEALIQSVVAARSARTEGEGK